MKETRKRHVLFGHLHRTIACVSAVTIRRFDLNNLCWCNRSETLRTVFSEIRPLWVKIVVVFLKPSGQMAGSVLSSLDTAALSHRSPASTGTSHDLKRCTEQM